MNIGKSLENKPKLYDQSVANELGNQNYTQYLVND